MQFPKMTNHTVCLFQWLWYQKQSASDYNGDLLKQWWQKGRADDVENNMHTSQQKSDKSDTTAGMGLVTTTEPDCLPAAVLTVVCLKEKWSADAKNNMHSTVLKCYKIAVALFSTLLSESSSLLNRPILSTWGRACKRLSNPQQTRAGSAGTALSAPIKMSMEFFLDNYLQWMILFWSNQTFCFVTTNVFTSIFHFSLG